MDFVSETADSSDWDGEGFALGQSINNKYVIEQEIGRGGMGLTFLGYDTENFNRKVVIKTIFKAYLTDEGKGAFLKEAEALGRINYDGVVRLFEKGIEIKTGLPFMVMEFVKGIELDELINRDNISIGKAVNITEKIALALTAAHEKGVLHRDIKPANILIIENELEDDKIKLIDFGIAKVIDAIVGFGTTRVGSFKGTLQYASPEQLSGFQTIAGETYNLALVCYELLTKTKPFPINVSRNDGDCDEDVYARVFKSLRKNQEIGAANPNIHNPAISQKMAEVVLKGLEYDSDNRYQTPLEFVRALKSSSEIKDLPIVKKTSFPKYAVGLISLLALLLVSGLLFALWNNLKPGTPLSNTNTNTNSTVTPTITPILTSTTAKIESLFSFSFEVQKMKDNLINGEVFSTDDHSKINHGDKFNLIIERQNDGNFYLLEQNLDTLVLLFPTGTENPKLITRWNLAKPTQTFWLVWSKAKLPKLEQKPLNSLETIQFLAVNQKNIDATTNHNKIVVKSSDDLVIYKMSF